MSVVVTAALLAGCAVGPNYKRPAVAAPATHRGAGNTAVAGTEASLADQPWQSLFDDPQLQELVQQALENNFDVRIAVERIEQTRAQYGISTAKLLPTVDANARFTAQRGSSAGSIIFVPLGTNLDVAYTDVAGTVNWELDLWGRLRRLRESARAQFLASQDARYGVQTTLVADVTLAYLTLRELDLELEIAEKTRKIAEDGLRLTKLRRTNGVATGLDVRQAETLLYTATVRLAETRRKLEQQENAIHLLLGGSPGTVKRGKALREITGPAAVPAGLPSALLERRPDVRQAEQQLVAANAQIGVAKSQYFPQISLTGQMGQQSRSLSTLFTGPARLWSFSPGVTLPIFNAGRIRNDVRYSEAVQREAELNYQKTVQTAFREVSDSLIAHERVREQREQQQRLVDALTDSARLSNARYRGGLDSYLQVLDAERNLFSGELALAQLQLAELNTVVQLYRALGGGWRQ
jgi:multidrug efflux system outer membrane protein